MLAVLLAILKWIGIALLWILIVLAVLIACLLFTPFVYRGTVRKNEENGTTLRATVSWLFRLIYVKAEFRAEPGAKGNPSLAVYVFGVPLLKVLAWFKKRRAAKGGLTRRQKKAKKQQEKAMRAHARQRNAQKRRPAGANGYAEASYRAGSYTGAKKKPTVKPHAEMVREAEEKALKEKAVIFERKQPNILIRIGAYISSFFGKCKKFFRKLSNLRSRIGELLSFLRSQQFTAGVRVIKREGVLLLKHIRPRRIKGNIAFGFEDPSATGKLLGVLGVLYPVIPEKLILEPDFENKRLEADVHIRGHFFLIVLLVRALKILLNKDVKALLRKFKEFRKDAQRRKREAAQKPESMKKAG